jgi:Ca-activated chloride channel family protein
MMTASAAEMAAIEESSGGRLVSVDGRTLPLVGAGLTTRARGGLARTVLEQRFRNPHPDPLRVTYLFPLPHDGAVSAYAFRIGDRRIVGEVDRREAARERFEEAIASGRTAGLVDQERGSVFTQELGNVPPGAEVVVDLTVDQRLAWLPTGSWEWRFPATVAPRYQGAPGRVEDAERIRVDVADAPLAPRLTLDLAVRDALAEGRRPESPSHPVTFRTVSGALHAAFAAEEGVPLDRDVVVRWPVASAGVGLSVETFRAASGPLAGTAFGLLTVVPPSPESGPSALPRDLVVLIDTSGSMHGRPLEQARRIVAALVDSLGEEDRLELIEFSMAPRRWRAEPVQATEDARRSAIEWLRQLRAGGATEMREAVIEALRPLRDDAQRQVVLVTDGEIGFETEVVADVLAKLPAGSRLHTVGVGSAVNRSLTGPAARAGRGAEVVVGLDEDPERAARTLVAHTAAPIVTELGLSGSALVEHAPARLPDLFAGAPALVGLRLRPEGGEIRVTGKVAGGAWVQRLQVAPVEAGAGEAALAALFGRESVEDLEMRLAGGAEGREIDAAVEKLGLEFQISTRLTSWVAVSEEPTVDPTRPTRRERMPQQLPYGMSVEGLGLRGQGAPFLHGPASVLLAPGVALRSASFDAGALAKGPSLEEPARTPWRRLPSTLAGRVTLDRDGVLVVEIELAHELDWSPPAEVELVLRDGTRRSVRVLLDRTTAAGVLESGQTLRLALEHGEPALGEALARIQLDMGGHQVRIAIRPPPRPRARRPARR